MGLRRSLLPPATRPITPDVSLFIVNIVLLLILFFLATGSLVNTPDQGVRLSETQDLPIDQLPSPILTVAPGGALSLDGTALARTDLAEALRGATVLHVLIEREAPALELLRLMDQPGLGDLDIRLVTIHRRSDR